MNHVIIGNGVAGITGAMGIRAVDPGSRVTVVSGETPYFFSRTALMYIAMEYMRQEDTEPFERSHYESMNIKLVHDRAVLIDPTSATVALENGAPLAYDRLLIATGSVPAMYGWPGSDLEGVINFVSCNDLKKLCSIKKKAGKAVVVGGGLIGIELAEVLLHFGIEVSFLIREHTFWPTSLSPEEGRMIQRDMEKRGIRVLMDTDLAEITGTGGRVSGVVTGTGERIESDIVGIATGVVPDTGLAKKSGIPVRRGVLVNDLLETGIPGIYGAGDCAERDTGEGPGVAAVWYAARDMGAAVGRTMAGEKTPYRPGPWYNSAKFFDLEYTCAGRFLPAPGDSEWHREDENGRNSIRIVHSSGEVLGFSMIGSRWDHRVLLDFIARRTSLDDTLSRLDSARFDPELVKSPAIRRVR